MTKPAPKKVTSDGASERKPDTSGERHRLIEDLAFLAVRCHRRNVGAAESEENR